MMKAEGRTEALSAAIIEYDDERNKYKLSCMVWDGIFGNARNLESSYHDTMEQAKDEAERIAQEYPNRRNDLAVLIVDDMCGQEAVTNGSA